LGEPIVNKPVVENTSKVKDEVEEWKKLLRREQ
jgi:hypothetical protein